MESLQIAICEDNRNDIESLKCIIAEAGVPVKIYTFADGNSLLSSFASGFFQLIFLDIYYDNGGDTAKAREDDKQVSAASAAHIAKPPALPEHATGVDVALRIREVDAEVWLAFLTVSPDYAAFGYKVDAKRYLKKPANADEVVSLLKKAEKNFSGRNNEISVTIDRKRCGLRMSDIRYIEACNKKCLIHLREETLATNTTIDALSKMLTTPAFLRCHRSYIVNLDYVQSVDRDFTMVNGDTVYIGHLAQWQVRSAYREHLLLLAREE